MKKLSAGKVFGFLTLIVVIASSGTFGLGSVQYAFAMNSPASSTSSSVVPQNTSIDLILEADDAPTSFQPPHNGNVFVVEHSSPSSSLDLDVDSPFVLGEDCTIDDSDVEVGTRYWRLHNADHSLAHFDLPAMGDSATVSFTDGTIVAAQSTIGGATWSDASMHWHEYTTGNIANGAGVPDLGTIGDNWIFQDCGVEDNNQGSGGLKKFIDAESFEVAVPVGGTILPIDVTSLIVAGVMTQQIGLVTGLLVVAGLSVVVVKFFVKPKLN